MKNLFLLLTVMLVFTACGKFGNAGSISDAEKHFIEEVQYMTEQEALSKEVSYYKAPVITISKKVRDLTGCDAIHECNQILEDNQNTIESLKSGKAYVVRTIDVAAEKDFAVNHPDDVVGAEYYFEGEFTHWNNGSNTRKARVLYINGRYIVLQQY
jgi:cytochrome c biogenesis protein ResB